VVLAVHLLLRSSVRKYYASHLQHYDSIGSYTFACEVLNVPGSYAACATRSRLEPSGKRIPLLRIARSARSIPRGTDEIEVALPGNVVGLDDGDRLAHSSDAF
jgi:hypothetical protein